MANKKEWGDRNQELSNLLLDEKSTMIGLLQQLFMRLFIL